MAISSGETLQAAHHGGGLADGARERDERRRSLRWALAAGTALLAGALWLREPSLPYLIACTAATVFAVVPLAWWLAAARRAGRAWPWSALVATGTAAAFCVVAAVATATFPELDVSSHPPAAAASDRAVAALDDALRDEATALRERADAALAAPRDVDGAFHRLAALVRPDADDGVVLYRNGTPVAWAGRIRVAPDTTRGHRFAAPSNDFYVTLQAAAERGGDRAVATRVVHAEPPADRLANAMDEQVARRAGVLGFDVVPVSPAAGASAADSAAAVAAAGPDTSGRVVFAPAGERLFVATPRVYQAGEARLRAVEDARTHGAPLLALAVACLVAAVWRRPSTLTRRLAALGVALAALGLVPLNVFSNASRLFDPSFYFVPLGGPFTGSIAALGATSAIVLLALLAVLRAPLPVPSRWAALVAVVAIAGVGPFLLRKLAGGIYPPPAGVSIALWLAWEITVCLAATSVLLAGASAGRAVLGARRGIPPWVAPALAAGAALLGPPLWSAPGRWPEWYPLLWVAAIGALALARRGRGFVLTAAAVAGCGAATLVWGVTSRKRVELAERDVAGLSTVDPYARALLERFGAQLAADDAPRSRADLLQSYVTSDLAAAEYPVALTAWTPQGAVEGGLTTGSLQPRAPEAAALADSARRSGALAVREVPGVPGVELLLAVPHSDGRVTTAVVAPRTRLIPDDPYAALIGVGAPEPAEPPYSLTLVESGGRHTAAFPAVARWKREGNELHGDWIVSTAAGRTRAHVEVELRSLDALVQRGALVVLVDLAVVAALWTLAALGDGGFARWLRRRAREWGRSYRARLTGVLFGFFMLPALAFVVWSYQRLQNDDRQSRELLVRETLRAASAADDGERLADESERLETPLLLYGARGTLRATSDTLLEELAPIGRFVDPGVYRDLVLGEEVTASRREPIGVGGTLFGFRAATASSGEHVVIAAPARTDELQLDRRRRDLGVLVMFAAALGALAALGLSGVAARALSRPIGTLQGAALAIARGEREPVPPGEPPAEFAPVFSAFRRMAAELSESRYALEEAQRRTAAVLRNVASGVVAVSGAGEVAIANPRAALLLGCELPPGTPIDCIGAPEIETRVRAFIDSGASGEEEFDVEHDGRQLHARLTTVGWRAPGSAERPTVVLTVDDVTELARAQRVLAWGEMARQVAHEIKNPLTPIRLGVQHLRRARHNPRVDFDAVLEQNVGRILAEIDRLDEIARAFSRYGTAPAERPPAEPVDVAAVARDVIALERMGHDGDGDGERAGERSGGPAPVSWVLEVGEHPVVAFARDEELREVLLNILENARLAHARSVRVRVSRDVVRTDGAHGDDGHGDGPEDRVRLVVTDDGVGIAPEALPRVFEPHFSTRTSGSGLGLAISRRIIDGWGGSIAIESEPAVGTKVTIELRPVD